jgi:uncharacterized membrane protein YedE/YeeE
MRYVLLAIKALLVLGLLVIGVWTVLSGGHTAIARISYKGLDAYGVPIGIAFIVAGIALAYFWKIQTQQKVTERTDPDGWTTRTTESTNNFIWKPPSE